MTSVLNVDTIAAKNGTSPVALTKQSAAKAFSHFNPSTNVENASFNQSSRTDDGTGFSTLNFINSMSSSNYSSHQQCSRVVAPTTGTGGYISSTYAEATSYVKIAYGYGNTWVFFDYENQKFIVHGDLA